HSDGTHFQWPGCARRGLVVWRAVVYQHRRMHGSAAYQGPDLAHGDLRGQRHSHELRGHGAVVPCRLREPQHDARQTDMSTPTLLIMAGGTGGHIMPGLAVAHEMKSRGWRVLWLGHPDRMEGGLVPPQGFELLPLRFSGVRGKGPLALLKLPFTLTRAGWQAHRMLGRIRPDVVLGMGGYVAFPGGVAAALRRIPLVIHEQNAVAGTANRWLAKLASKVLVGFPGALPGAVMVGNPVRNAIVQVKPAAERYQTRQGPLRLLVVGGSLGAAVL